LEKEIPQFIERLAIMNTKTKLEVLIYDNVADVEARNELLVAVRRIASLEAALEMCESESVYLRAELEKERLKGGEW
jgi:hypothetical protein